MQICPNCFDDMSMVSTPEELKFVCTCGYEDKSWNLVETAEKVESSCQ